MSGRVGLNIQIYTDTADALEEITRLYLGHGLADSAFLMLRSFAEAERVRSRNSAVAICVGEERENLERHLSFGVDFVQPTKRCLSDTYVRRVTEARIPAKLRIERDQLEREIRVLRDDHDDLEEAKYLDQLEVMLLRMAEIYDSIK